MDKNVDWPRTLGLVSSLLACSPAPVGGEVAAAGSEAGSDGSEAPGTDVSSDETSTGGAESDTTGSDDPVPEPLWEYAGDLESHPYGGVVLDVATSDDGSIRAAIATSDSEYQSYVIQALSSTGSPLWAAELSFPASKICVGSGGTSYAIGYPSGPVNGDPQPRLARVSATGVLEWEVNPTIPPITSLASTRMPGIECKDGDESVLLVEALGEVGVLLHFDGDGNEVNRIEDPLTLDMYRPSSIVLKEDGQLLVAGTRDDFPSEPFIARLDASGQQLGIVSLGGTSSLGTYLASHGSSYSFMTVNSSVGIPLARIHGLGDDGAPIWSDSALDAPPSGGMTRALAVNEDGVAHVIVPRQDGKLLLRRVGAGLPGETILLRHGSPDSWDPPHALALGIAGELVIAGTRGSFPWIVAYDLD